jgi:hypothetical protein
LEAPRGWKERGARELGHARAAQASAGAAEVVAGSGKHGVAAVAAMSFEVIAAHPVLGLDIPNDRLDRGAAPHLAADRGSDAAHLATDPDAELLRMVVAARAFVDMDAVSPDPGQRLQLGDDRPKVSPSKGLPCSALACSTNAQTDRL